VNDATMLFTGRLSLVARTVSTFFCKSGRRRQTDPFNRTAMFYPLSLIAGRRTIMPLMRLLRVYGNPWLAHPTGLTGLRPAAVLPSPPPCGVIDRIHSPRHVQLGALPRQRIAPACRWNAGCALRLPTSPIVALQSTCTFANFAGTQTQLSITPFACQQLHRGAG